MDEIEVPASEVHEVEAARQANECKPFYLAGVRDERIRVLEIMNRFIAAQARLGPENTFATVTAHTLEMIKTLVAI